MPLARQWLQNLCSKRAVPPDGGSKAGSQRDASTDKSVPRQGIGAALLPTAAEALTEGLGLVSPPQTRSLMEASDPTCPSDDGRSHGCASTTGSGEPWAC